MKTFSKERNWAWSRVLGLALLIPFLPTCVGESDQARAQQAETDSASTAMAGTGGEGQAGSQSGGQRPTSPRIPYQEQANQPIQISEMGYNLGASDAPVKVLELSDFGCGYCRRFHQETFPGIREIYVDAGFVEWKFIPYVLGMFPNGLEAATAGECAGEQGEFFPMQESLFASQSAWRNSDDPNVFFAELATEVGMDVARFEACLRGGWKENQVRSNIRLGMQAGVRGTPLFLIDGRPLPGAVPLDDFRKILDAALLQRGITPPPQ